MGIGEQPPSDSDTTDSEKEQKSFYERFHRDIQNPRFAIEVVALVFLVLYTIFSGYQSCKMRQATKATITSSETAKKEFEMSERPWIAVVPSNRERNYRQPEQYECDANFR